MGKTEGEPQKPLEQRTDGAAYYKAGPAVERHYKEVQPKYHGEILNDPKDTDKMHREAERLKVEEEQKKQREKLKTSVEQNETPNAMYTFKRSIHEVPDSEKDITAAGASLAKKIGETDGKVKVELYGTADNTNFRLDPRSSTPRVKLDYGASWQRNYLNAFNAMKGNPSYPELTGLDFAKKGIYAIHDLNIADQQKMMNHCIAYLRALRLQKQLLNDTKNSGRLVFEIKTEWKSDPDTRVATLMNVTTKEVVKD